MPILNKLLLLKVLAVVLLLGGGLFGIHYVQAGRLPDTLLWHASAAADKGKADKAIFYMRQYLEFRPNDYDNAIKLADMILDRGNGTKDLTNAHFLYERVLREAPDRTDVGRKLIDICLRLHRYGDALIHAERLLQKNPNDGDLQAKLGECLINQNRHEEARKALDKAIVYSPDNIRAYEIYSRLLRIHFRKIEEAESMLNRMVASNPSSPDAFRIRANHLKDQNKHEECMRDIDRLLLLDPENADGLLLSAEIYQTRGDIRQARETFRDLTLLYPKEMRGYRSLSWLELLSGNQADAMACLERGIAAIPDSPDLLTPLADIWLEQGQFDRVETVMKKLEAKSLAPAQANYLRGRLLMKQGKWSEALTTLDQLRAEAMDRRSLQAQLNLLVAACQEKKGDLDAQMESLRRLLRDEPSHLGGRVAMANVHLDAGRMDAALKEYQLAARTPYAGLGVRMTYAQLRLARIKLGQATPDEADSLAKYLNEARQQNAESIEPVVLLSDLLATKGDFTKAESMLRLELTRKRGDFRLWTALANLTARSRGTVAAFDILGEAQLAVGDSVDLRLTRARLWADDYFPGRDSRIAQLEEQAFAAGEADRIRLLAGLADCYEMIGDEAGMKRVCSEWTARSAQDLTPRKQLYRLALKEKDGQGIARWKGDIERLEGASGVTVKILDMLFRGTDFNDTAGKILADETLRLHPTHREALLLAARAEERNSDSNVARKYYESLCRLDPTSLSASRERLAFNMRKGNAETIKNEIQRLASDPRLTQGRLIAIYDGTFREVSPETWTKSLAAFAPLMEREPRVSLWVGKMMQDRGMSDPAREQFRILTSKYPQFVDGWNVRIVSEVAAGPEAATSALAEARKHLDAKSFFGICAESGSFIRAKIANWVPPLTAEGDRRAYAQAALTICEVRGRVEDAIPILKSIANDQGAKPEDAVWAKQSLAILMAATGTKEQRQEAAAVLKQSTSGAGTLEEMRARVNALGLAVRSAKGEERHSLLGEMTTLLAKIVQDPGVTSNDWFQLAQLYRAQDQREEATRCLAELIRREPENLLFVSAAVDDYLSSNQIEKARPLVPKLVAGAKEYRVAAAAVRFYTLANEPRQVVTVIEKYVRAVDLGTSDGAARQRQAADLLAQMTQLAKINRLSGEKELLAEACERFRASQRAFPDSVAAMSALLASEGQVEQAFTELNKVATQMSPSQLALAGAGILRSGPVEPKHFKLVRDWTEKALEATPQSLAMKLNLAEIYAIEENFSRAEVLYKEVLQADPKNAIALNNLAWIMAPRPESAEQALKLADQAIALYGSSGEMLDTKARILIAAGQADRAVIELNEAIARGQTPLRYFHLALAQMKQSKPGEAKESFKAARARGLDTKMIHPADMPAYQHLVSQTGS
jgi:tetratricopeptide (TPR) repeat protein